MLYQGIGRQKWFNYSDPVSIFGLNSETLCPWFLYLKEYSLKDPGMEISKKK